MPPSPGFPVLGWAAHGLSGAYALHVLITFLPKHVQLTQGHAEARARDWTESGGHQGGLGLTRIPLKPEQAEVLVTVL